MSELEEIFEVLKEINEEKGKEIDNDLLERIIAIVIKNPLDEDRRRCQDQIDMILQQYLRGVEP